MVWATSTGDTQLLEQGLLIVPTWHTHALSGLNPGPMAAGPCGIVFGRLPASLPTHGRSVSHTVLDKNLNFSYSCREV